MLQAIFALCPAYRHHAVGIGSAIRIEELLFKTDFPQSAGIFILCHAYRHPSEEIGLVLSTVVTDSIVKQNTNLVQN